MFRLALAIAVSVVLSACSKAELPAVPVPAELVSLKLSGEVRPVLPRVGAVRLDGPIAAGCEISAAIGVEGAIGTVRFEVHALLTGGRRVRLASQNYRAGAGWTDVRVRIPEPGAEAVRFEMPELVAGAPVIGAWAAPFVACPEEGTDTERPNVIVISLDTLRADRLGAYGSSRNLAPELDRLAAAGTLFERAYSQYPNTLGSHATMFTGRYPTEHGVGPGSLPKIADSHQTLAEVFTEHGYYTAAFTENAYVGSGFGYDKGFQRYSDGPDRAPSGRFPGEARVTFGAGARWLERRPAAPFLLFLHTYEVHTPYTPSRELVDEMTERFNPGYEVASDVYGVNGKYSHEPLKEIAYNRGKLKLRPTDIRQIEVLYDSEVRVLDEQVGILFERLRELELLESTYIVLTSDHGDAFNEHRFLGHGEQLNTETMHVPLVFLAPGRVEAARRIAEPVGLIDIAPTLAELAGIHGAYDGVQGVSLANVVLGKSDPEPRPVFSELDARMASCEVQESGAFKRCPYAAVALRDTEYTYIESAAEGTRELYDVATDPGELHDLSADLPQVVERYAAEVARFRAGLATPPSPEDAVRAVDRATEDNLRALGYIE